MQYFLIIVISLLLTLLLSKIILPLLNKLRCNQSISRTLERHITKEGTPTLGGFIFIIPFIIIGMIYKINILLIIPTIMYAILGFIDDYLKIIKHNNKGLSIIQKFLLELLIAIIFYYLYLIKGYSNYLCIFNYKIDIGFIYGIWMLLMLVGFTNAVNITDGLDGLACGLTIIVLFSFLFVINTKNIILSTLILISSLCIFLYFNRHPAKVFMGDLGSLFLGSYMVCMSFLIKKEYLLIIIGSIFIFEIFTSFIQVISIKFFKRKVFLKAPFHHHLEEYNMSEDKIVRYFYIAGIIMALIGLLLEKINIFI